jgi:hypothetical protein
VSDILRIVILGDGTIRTETDRVSAPNHQSAEEFLSTVSKLTGGDATRQRKGHAHTSHGAHVHAGHSHEE